MMVANKSKPRDPEQYIVLIVEPLLNRLRADENSIELRWAAEVACYHFKDHLNAALKKSLKERGLTIERALSEKAPNFPVLDFIANANKHSKGARDSVFPEHPSPDVTLARTEPFLISTKDGVKRALINGKRANIRRAAMYVLPDGRSVHVLRLLEAILAAARELLNDFRAENGQPDSSASGSLD